MPDITGHNLYDSEERLIDFLDTVETLVEELRADHATNRTSQVELAHLNNNYYMSTAPAVDIVSNFDVKIVGASVVVIAGIKVTITANTVADTGTTKTITAAKWSAFVVDASAAATATAIWEGGNAVLSAHATEALALASAKTVALVTGNVRLCIVTVLAGAALWTAGTDALTTGTGGTVATTTTYYGVDVNPMHVYVEPAATLTAADPTNNIVPKGTA